ncbi:hypothetical protein TPHA_0D01600 [Tetrapisispora phaffii CBS 4417]|uniref:Uncharacterized protein n=1 Tax=Tetrapisispora phaffii (strain ATCC 24235 / CBS 4417 / NBRC 1672 / NRRL Y-8282 / UCD 70-5) TaxID=1071381 RepID=G8BSH9_TETPH|nr:hypothetical protein TPHA_0D01600 [Tetrapisispora phaffii CBS 4417]CCE62800.1 hypothetical protein TPHA_0D01600 [Tetrapisispora phaffii CBS 4417]
MEGGNKENVLDEFIKALVKNGNIKDRNPPAALSDKTLDKLIELRVEMEKTKQFYYILENKTKVVEILKLCEKLDLPKNEIIKYLESNGPSSLPVTPKSNIDELNGPQYKRKETALSNNERENTIESNSLPLSVPISKFNEINIAKSPDNKQNNEINTVRSENILPRMSPKRPIISPHSQSTELTSPINKKYSIDSKMPKKHLRTLSVPVLRLHQNSDIPSSMTSILGFPKDTDDFQDHFTHTFAFEKPLNVTNKKQPFKSKHIKTSMSQEAPSNLKKAYEVATNTSVAVPRYPLNQSAILTSHQTLKEDSSQKKNEIISSINNKIHKEINGRSLSQTIHKSSLSELLNNT